LKSTPLIIGHRGASAVAPENTIAAFREALAVGADGIEFDVRLTRYGVPVVIHDSTLRRTGGLPHRVADLTWAEISKVDVGSWFSATFANETVPSLAELFTLFQSNISNLYLEMKSDSASQHRALAEACIKAIDEHAMKERVIVECFQLPALKILKEIDSEIKTVALFEPSFTNPSVLSDQRIINQARDVGAAALALHHRLARESLVQKAKDAGLHVAVWTVDDPAWIEKARATRIDALISNDPAKMLRVRGA
jgi:glycerophosphoryl diester phosphodiesterase